MQAKNPASTAPRTGAKAIVPVMFAFFVMGFVDLVGTATNYVKPEFGLSDTQANLLTTMVFFWFLIFSVPTGVLMNRIGRRRTVLLSILVTVGAMLLPVIAYTACASDGAKTARLVLIVIGFILLGIGNTLMQVSLNPLLALFVKGNQLASTLTTGQFVKAFASLFAPFIASWASRQLGKWWLLFAIYLVIGIVGYVLLAFDKIDESGVTSSTTTIGRCFKLLADPVILLCFLGIVSHVGVDVGVNAQAPRILMEHTDIALETATNATMVYFIARMIGCFTGGIALKKLSNKVGLRICGVIMVLSAVCFAIFSTTHANPPVALFWIAVALIGFGNSNVFSLFLSQALITEPERQNEVSGLMMMGLIGGAIFPPLMGAAAGAIGQIGAILVMSIGCLYVLVTSICFRALERKK
ncbi:MAG: MFS transporter [Bifidobacteriaceae bacterium]|nr:MFS transporter [Bifidobacteriaceae bacterium]